MNKHIPIFEGSEDVTNWRNWLIEHYPHLATRSPSMIIHVMTYEDGCRFEDMWSLYKNRVSNKIICLLLYKYKSHLEFMYVL